ncbi:plasmid mobilization protein [Staphylococcus pseudintermedius]|uniref:plasmid mobilization protein n=1 Tax=Staphylococcus pseudintermedius TaxID=283734 RepID=UPI00143F28CE|nr:hypothetical protein [Staphylococcus pseudintermedius]EGQ0380206.1 hypothetical protein [Staphylococcus pseudintermedius]EGQ1635738.1 hypothetical protein [Staphylococcus pseudintermedius]EGQ1640769.1 hypothetical protein [Staphylococcus pseudintermedius]EGQ1676755.1 hypothetical protein [Staphylococcus pseudintermedius]EGQ1737876.1 hypothetical protein [Staphylococcus pseudintermedius]
MNYKITISLTKEQKEKIDNIANLLSIKVTEYIRLVSLGNIVKPLGKDDLLLNHLSIIRNELNRVEILNRNYEEIINKYESNIRKNIARELIILIEKVKAERMEANENGY